MAGFICRRKIVFIESAVVSHLGNVRKNNEDNFFLHGKIRDNLSEHIVQTENTVKDTTCLFAVFDGMGGEEDGEMASWCAAMAAKNSMEKRAWSLSVFLSEFRKIINEKQIKEESGCTAAMLSVRKSKIQAYNLGDSRVYIYHTGRLKQISVDHTQAQLLVENGLLQQKEARTHKGGHILTRCLTAKYHTAEKDFYQPQVKKARAGDIFLLCSDGLTDMLTDDQISKCLQDKQSAPAGQIANDLCKKALEAGGKDNVTCLIVKIIEAGRETIWSRIRNGEK